MLLKIAVTQDDIDHGRAGNCRTCPVAVAAQRYGRDPLVGIDVLWIKVGGQEYRGDLPPKVMTFIRAFDAIPRGPVAPFEFQVELEPWKEQP